MPTSEKQRRAAFAELNRRKKGGKPSSFKGMSSGKLESYAHEELHTKKRSKPHRKGSS